MLQTIFLGVDADVGVDDVEPSLWSLCKQCGLAGQRIELVVDVGIVYFVFAVALTDTVNTLLQF